ncbi:MAG: hypothetical protein IPM47_15780 [Sphingobacteriales bacterium]|nr:MAG: hypothetical protein IPM47_15780 [Sphingobacteriales bacterium]
MIELDDLKNAWQEFSKAQEEQHKLDAAQIRQALEKRTHSAVGKIRRALSIDMALLAFFTITLLIYALLFNKPLLSLLLFVFGIVWSFTLFVNIALHSLLNRVFNVKADLKTSLIKLVNYIGRGLNTINTIAMFAPLAGVFIGYIMTSHDQLTWQIFLLLLAVGVMMGLAFFPLMRWYTNKMVGQHYQELKQCLNELQEED